MVDPDAQRIPPLPPDAGPQERLLHEIYGFAQSLVEDTATDWGQTADGVTSLATEVRSVITRLQGADQPWEGPAATSAYSTLTVLARVLDERAEEIRAIKRGLDSAVTAASTAETGYLSQVRTVSTYVDPDGYRPTDGGTFNVTGYEAAIEGRREQREAAARTVLSSFDDGMRSAAKQMPVEAPDDSVMVDPGAGGSGGGGGGGTGGSGGGGGGYTPPSGGTGGPATTVSTGFVPTGQHPTTTTPPPTTTTTTPPVHEPWTPDCGVVPDVDLDGGTTGTTAPTAGGDAGWAGTTSPSGASGSTSGGLGAGAAGAGGLLGGGAMLLGRGALARGAAFGVPGAAGSRPGPLVAGSTGTAGRGSTTNAAGARGAAATGRPVVAPGGQGAAARGGRGAGSGIRGARTGGRYGVPRLGSSGEGGRGVVAGSGAGGRGRTAKDRDDTADVESLTHEDEETWFEGEDQAGPSVWR